MVLWNSEYYGMECEWMNKYFSESFYVTDFFFPFKNQIIQSNPIQTEPQQTIVFGSDGFLAQNWFKLHREHPSLVRNP